VSQLILKSRSQFRASKGISEDKYIFYIDAGTNAKQAKFSLKSYKNGFGEFLSSSAINTINPSHFHLFVYVPSNVNIKSLRPQQTKSKPKLNQSQPGSQSPLSGRIKNMLPFQQLILDCFTMEKLQLRLQPCSSPVSSSTI
jgi:hypothetical protein